MKKEKKSSYLIYNIETMVKMTRKTEPFREDKLNLNL